jgi:Animal haem peroxidase
MSSWSPTQSPSPTTPTGGPTHGGTGTRGLDNVPSAPTIQGRFGRMFRNLPVFALADQDEKRAELRELAKQMIQEVEADKPLDADDEDQNPDIPAGYTYLGQFIDHDITFDPSTSLQRQNDPESFVSFRTPRLDLDSLYGRGPADQPYLYQGPEDGDGDPAKLRLGESRASQASFGGPDLPRLGTRAVIGDPRNDENLIVSQLHSVFLRFHNAVVDRVRSDGLPDTDDVFKEAQRLVRWHYQWVVVHDFLGHVVGSEVVGDILRPKDFGVIERSGDRFALANVGLVDPDLRFYHFQESPFIPVEFSVAAYRFGHPMVRPSYFFNDFVRGHTQPNRTPIFTGNHDLNNLENLNGGRPLPPDWGFQWKYFFALEEESGLPQPSYRIDDELVNPLGALPDPPAPTSPEEMHSLAFRNLLRGVRLGLPSGEAVAGAMNIPPLSAAELDLANVAPSFVGHAPLWYYILREAKIRCDGRRLGPVGGRIVAEVLIGLLNGDPLSYLRVEPGWKPTLATTNGDFAMPDLIRAAGAA